MKNRHLLSYLLFILGIVLLLGLGLAAGQLTTGVLLGLACMIGGLILYRRGK
jgi:hypothetical protein